MFFASRTEKVYKLLDSHMESVISCFSSFVTFIDKYISGSSFDELSDIYSGIDCLERDADNHRRDVISELTGMIITNTRNEILDITQSIDIVANKAQSISRRIIHEQIKMPGCVNIRLYSVINLTKEQLAILTNAIQLLFNNNPNIDSLNNLLTIVKNLEGAVDELEYECISAIYDSHLPLAEKMHAGRCVNAICDISDYIEDIADKIQIMIVTRKG